jgi:hypothetical protein
MQRYFSLKSLAAALPIQEKLLRNRLQGIRFVFYAGAKEQPDESSTARLGRPTILHDFQDMVMFAAIVSFGNALSPGQRAALRDAVEHEHKAWAQAIKAPDDLGLCVAVPHEAGDPVVEYSDAASFVPRINVHNLAAWLRGRFSQLKQRRRAFYAAESYPPDPQPSVEIEEQASPENVREFRKK